MAERWTSYAEVEQSEHLRKPSQDLKTEQMQYKRQEAVKYLEQDCGIVSEVTKKMEQANVPSWDSCISNDPSSGRKYTHLDLMAPSWASQWHETNEEVGLITKKAQQEPRRQREAKFDWPS